jgi:farnesyl-diphosphate farnesyltransferase
VTGGLLSQPAQPSLDELLELSSRTFALTIPFLPEPERAQVTVAYLLFRIADTLEDATEWSGDRRAAGLRRFEALLRDSGATGGSAPEAAGPEAAGRFAAQLLLQPPTAHAGYLSLLRASPSVFAALSALPAAARAAIVAHTARTASGMADLCARLPEDGSLELRTLAELRGYCYLVAGIVGELLTELFLLTQPQLAPAAAALRADARAFGEGLQLTNILKDAAQDASEGRRFLPPEVPLAELFALAREDLAAAQRYVGTLAEAGAPGGLLGFTALPVRLAIETLLAVEARGPGAKVPRASVARATQELTESLHGPDPSGLQRLLSGGWLAPGV